MTLRQTLLLWLLVILSLIIGAVGLCVYFYVDYQTTRFHRVNLICHLLDRWECQPQARPEPGNPRERTGESLAIPPREGGPFPPGERPETFGPAKHKYHRHPQADLPLESLSLTWPNPRPNWARLGNGMILVRYYDPQLKLQFERGGDLAPALPTTSSQHIAKIKQAGLNAAMFSTSTNYERWDALAVRVLDPQGNTVGFVELAQGCKPEDDLLKALALALLSAGAIALTVGAISMGPLVMHLTKPLENLAQAANQVSLGRFDIRVPLGGTTELRSLARDFNHMVTQIESLFSSQRRFLADASHELKTPLTSLATTTELLQSGLPPHQYQKALGILSREIDRMSSLITDLLTLSKIEAEVTSELQTLDLAQPITELVSDYLLRHPNLSFKRPEPPLDTTVVGAFRESDWTRVVRNIIDNALNYTPADRDVLVLLHPQTRQKNGFLMTVLDKGPGIAQEELAKVTERFYRADPSRSRQTGGHGLGLSIVSSWVDKVGGQLEIHSILGEGTEVQIWIPKNP